jgi:hypothetical protein
MSTSFRLSDHEVEQIAHGLGHYETSHGNLPLFTLPKYTCDPDDWGTPKEVGYRDVRGVFEELLASRAVIEAAGIVESCHGHTMCSRCSPGLTEALLAFHEKIPQK